MNSGSEAPASSMPPPQLVHSEETRRYTKDEWEAQKPFIIGMYHIPGMTLKKIADYLLKERGFSATQRQLKRKVATWRLDKNVKEHEMEGIVRKQARLKAKGKTASFSVRGQPVAQAKIERFQKRKGYAQASFISQQAISPTPTTPTLSDISYNAISERGTLSPSAQPIILDMNQGYRQLRNTDSPFHSPRMQMTAMQEFDRRDGHWTPFGSQPSDIIQFTETQSDFGGQSPAPFTAPPSPAPSRGEDSIDVASASSNSSTQSLFATFTPNEAPTMSDVPKNSMRIRYRQHDEHEHRNRLDTLVRQFGPDHPAALDTRFRLGDILKEQGRYRAAEIAFRQVIEGCIKTSGNSHSSTINAYFHLSDILKLQGKLTNALALSKEVYTTAMNSLHPTDEVLLNSKMILASCLDFTARHVEAEALFREVLRARGSVLAPDDGRALDCLRSLARCIHCQGKYDEGEKILREVVMARSLSLGAEHVIVQHDVSYLCLSLLEQGKFSECEIKVKQLLEVQAKMLGSEHPETIFSLSILVSVLLRTNRFTEGENMARDVVKKISKVLGPGHPIRLQIEITLLKCLLQQKRYVEAESLGTKIMPLSERHSTPGYNIQIKMMVGRIYLAQGRIEEGRSIFEKAMNEALTDLGEKHSSTVYTVSEYTNLVQDISRMDSETFVLKWSSRPLW